MLKFAVSKGRDAFLNEAEGWLRPYTGVRSTLELIKVDHPNIPLVALTDAPRYVAMWKLNKLGLLSILDAVYGLTGDGFIGPLYQGGGGDPPDAI